jgi:hypothetical protein
MIAGASWQWFEDRLKAFLEIVASEGDHLVH